MCNEFNSGLFLSYIRSPFRALHIAETITDEEIKVNWHIFRNRIKAEIM